MSARTLPDPALGRDRSFAMDPAWDIEPCGPMSAERAMPARFSGLFFDPPRHLLP
jgi:hypothetical protein